MTLPPPTLLSNTPLPSCQVWTPLLPDWNSRKKTFVPPLHPPPGVPVDNMMKHPPPPPPPTRTTKKTCTYVDGVCDLHGPAKRTWKPVRVRTRGPDGRSLTMENREYSWKCKLLPGQTKLSFPLARTTRGTQEGDTRQQGEELDASVGQGGTVLRAGINLDRSENTDR